MRKDVKTGLVLGTAIVLTGWIGLFLFSDSLQQRRQNQLDQQTVAATEKSPLPHPVPVVAAPDKNEPIPNSRKNDGDKSIVHTVTEGQTLSSISILYYGVASKWEKILAANSDQIQRPSQIKPGMKLVIPPDNQ